ncbi:MAG: hypothetical protein ACOCZ8_02575 [Bacteroidota bacterium]
MSEQPLTPRPPSATPAPDRPVTHDAPAETDRLDVIHTEVTRLAAVYRSAWDASEQRPADAKFLDGLRWCIEQRIKLVQLQQDASATDEPGLWHVELNLNPPPHLDTIEAPDGEPEAAEQLSPVNEMTGTS